LTLAGGLVEPDIGGHGTTGQAVAGIVRNCDWLSAPPVTLGMGLMSIPLVTVTLATWRPDESKAVS
jgi:hypothetical protein